MNTRTDRRHPLRRGTVVAVLACCLSLIAAGCGDDGGGEVEASSSSTTVESTTTTTAVTETTIGDDVVEDGLEQFTASCRDGDPAGCQQLSDATLQEICAESQTVACQTYGARTGEGDPEGDGTVPFEEGCRAGELESCVQLSDPTLQTICDEGQTAACQVVNARG